MRSFLYIVSSRYVTSAIHARVPSPSTMLTKLFMYATTKREFLGYYAQNFKDAGSERLQGECFSILYTLISEIRESEFLLKSYLYCNLQ